MPNLFIIHSYNADTKESFGPSLKEQVEKLGIRVIYPDFPIGEHAKYSNWCNVMDKYLMSGELNSESMIVAHSLGTHFIPKYLADRNISVKLYISCAGFLNDHSGRENLQGIIDDYKPNDEQIDKFITLVDKRFSIYSNDDHMNPQYELENYADRLAATRVFVPNVGHMGARSGISELPEALEIIEEELNDTNKKIPKY